MMFAISSVFTGRANAADYPNVASLQAFTPEANFMSLPGYLRYLTFLQEGTWLTREEAVRIVLQQGGQPYFAKDGRMQ
jgi:hypothetical protein